MAMGSNVYVATNWSPTDYWYSSGTSFSCPLLAGACALLLQADPNLTPIELRELLKSTASQSSNPNNLYGWGIINTLAAVQSVLPVELISFTATYDNGLIMLKWATAAETNNAGFEIERKPGTESIIADSWEKIGYITGFGTTTEPQDYSFIDGNVSVGKYSYRLKQIDYDGTFQYSSSVEVNVYPKEFVLNQNYPNPFNPKTVISFQLAINGHVSLKVYNVLGQEMTALINENLEAGIHKIIFSADGLNSGVYFYTLEAKGVDGTNFISTKKMMVLK
jgi:hypothetical protein